VLKKYRMSWFPPSGRWDRQPTWPLPAAGLLNDLDAPRDGADVRHRPAACFSNWGENVPAKAGKRIFLLKAVKEMTGFSPLSESDARLRNPDFRVDMS
jgi:hypothetical protein